VCWDRLFDRLSLIILTLAKLIACLGGQCCYRLTGGGGLSVTGGVLLFCAPGGFIMCRWSHGLVSVVHCPV